MIKWSIHWEDLIITNVYRIDNKALKQLKTLAEVKRQRDHSTITEDIHTSLQLLSYIKLYKTPQQKIKQEYRRFEQYCSLTW